MFTIIQLHRDAPLGQGGGREKGKKADSQAMMKKDSLNINIWLQGWKEEKNWKMSNMTKTSL